MASRYGRTLIETGAGGLAGRFLASHRQRAVLTMLGVALGVALIAALTVLGATLQRAIAEQLRQGFGTYDIMAGYQDRMMTPEEQQLLRDVDGVRYAVGVLYLSPHRPETEGVPMAYNYIGIGRFPEGEFAYPLKEGRYPGEAEFVTEARMAERLGITIGDAVELPFRTGTERVRLVGLLPTQTASSDSLIFDTAWLQRAMGLEGRVTLQLFGLRPGVRVREKELIGAEMKARLPELDVQLRRELDEVRENMGGLRPLVIAFGLVGLFAAAFLVAGSLGIAVQERKRELALLRAVGAAPRQVERLVLREAALLGGLGGLLGLLLGALGAAAAVRAAATSLGVQEHPPVFPWAALAVVAGVGVALAVVAAWRPARAAGRVRPLEAMRPDAVAEALERKVGGLAGLVLLAVSTGMVGLSAVAPDGSGLRALLGALGGLLFTIGLIAAQPRLLPWMVAALAAPLRSLFPVEAMLAGRSVLRHRKRSGLTSATLILGVMLLTSMSTIFGGLERNHMEYLRSTIPGDAVVEAGMGSEEGLPPELVAEVAAVPGVRGVAPMGGRVGDWLVGFDYSRADPRWLAEQDAKPPYVPSGPGDAPAYPARDRFSLVPVDLRAMAAVFDFGRVRGDLTAAGIVVSEEQARQRGIEPGMRLTVEEHGRWRAGGRWERGEARTFPVVAVVERLPVYPPGAAAVSRSLYPDLPIERVVIAYDPERRAEVKTAVWALLRRPGYGTATLRDFADAMAEARQMMNQRSAVLWAVTGVIFLVAAFGLVNSVVTGLNQRRRELAALRAVGSTPGQTVRQVVLEAMLLGLSGSLLGLLAGVAFAGAVMVALGPLPGPYPVGLYLACLAAGPLVAAGASVSPALRVSRGAVTAALAVD